MADDLDNQTQDVAQLLFAYFNEIGIISQLSSNMFEQALPQGLTSAQFGVLNWFARVDSVATPGRLATAFQVTAGAMTNTLKKLEAKQYVKIEPDPLSGRKKRVTATEKGKAARLEAMKFAEPLVAELLAAVDMSKINEQITELRKMREYLDARRYTE